MKRTIKTILLLIVLVWIVVFLVGRIRWPIHLDQGWTSPVSVTSTENGFGGGGDLYKWHDTLILMNAHQDWLPHSSICSSSTCSIMIRNNDSSNSWTQLPPLSVPGDYAFYCPAFDQASDKVMFEGGYIENNQLMMNAIFARIIPKNGLQVEAERTWKRDQESLFGKNGTNVTLNEPARRANQPNRDYPSLGKGVLDGSEVYVPYCLHGVTQHGRTIYVDEGPFNNGVFHSTDFGESWQMEKISDRNAGEPEMCRTKDYYYYFGFSGGGIWFSRKPVTGGSWDEPKLLTKTSANQRGGGVLAENDMVHACWLDRRHEKWTLNFAFPYLGNYEVAYCRRKDTDSTWCKDVILSKGLLFSYWPSMSVEGDKIVVVWQSGGPNYKAHQSGQFFDIYYATSKDGGKTWAKRLKITDMAKDGITSERPQVALQNGIIHLFYAQGKWDPHAQVRNQGSWPVYYQQRPFPD